jgi:GTP-binding protein HflX
MKRGVGHMLTSLERAVLVGVRLPVYPQNVWDLSFAELQGLAETAGAQVVSEVVQAREVPDASTYIGRGKAEELARICGELEIELAVFDQELSPAQVRNLERILPCKVIDRTQLILDIFAGRARSLEGKLQVELAQLTYMLPRLTGRGASLSRLGGGIGTRGPGETKLETDRRRIRKRISDLRREIEEIRRHRQLHRARRKKAEVPVMALVGYTNAGKSTLMRTIVQRFGQEAGRVSEGHDRLFDTLDPSSRRIRFPYGGHAIVTDTVGFIQFLPHTLVDAFRATLEEVAEADLLIHVVDASHPHADVQMRTVHEVLEELHVLDKPIVTVLNKWDCVSDGAWFAKDLIAVETVAVSAKTGDGIDQLMQVIERQLQGDTTRIHVLLPYDHGSLLNRIHTEGNVWKEEFRGDGISIEADVTPVLLAALEPFL